MFPIHWLIWSINAIFLGVIVWQHHTIRRLKHEAYVARTTPAAIPTANEAVNMLEEHNFRITNLFQQVFDNNPDSCFILTPAGRFTFINKAAIGLCNRLGKPTHHLMVGESLTNVSANHLPDHFHTHFFTVVKEQSPLTIEYIEPYDGHTYVATFVPVQDGELEYVLVVIRLVKKLAVAVEGL